MTPTELLMQSIQPTVAFTVSCLITIRNASANHNEYFCPKMVFTGALLERRFVSLEPIVYHEMVLHLYVRTHS